MAKRKTQKFKLKLKGKTAVFIDWANVYNWKSSLKKEVDIRKLFDYLKSYPKIKEISFYFGTDKHPASKEQLKVVEKIGYRVVTKPVKYLPVIENNKIIAWKRKCDFDLEIGLDCFEGLEKYDGFIFFSGDGDFATLYKRLIKRKKQTIVVYQKGHLGREVWDLKKGIFKTEIKRFPVLKKMSPSRRLRA